MKKILLIFAMLLLFGASSAQSACTLDRGNGNCWTITGDTATDQIITNAKLKNVTSIHWYLPTTLNHKLHIVDIDGDEISCKLNAVVANQDLVIYYPGGKDISGLIVKDMDSGTVFINFGD